MAYSDISKSKLHFNSNYYVGNGSTQDRTDIGFKPDFVWIKDGTSANDNQIVDSIRGATKAWRTNATDTENTHSDGLTAFISNGFSLGNNTRYNQSGSNYRCWSWLAGGPSPAVTYKVVVVSDSGNKYRFRNSADTATFGSSAVTVDLQEGGTYTFDVSDSTVNSHPFVLGTSSGVDGSYSTGVTYKLDGVTKTYSQYTSGFSSATSRQLIITVAGSAPTLYYNCSVHSGMGGAINTNSKHGSSNFDGSLQTLVSENTTAGFSIVRWTGTTDKTIGHGLGVKPAMMICKSMSVGSTPWLIWHKNLDSSSENQNYLLFSDAAQAHYSNYWGSGGWTSEVFGVASDGLNNNRGDMVGYVFAEKPGYCKIGKYDGNNDSDGAFIYTGFKPSFVLTKKTDGSGYWVINDTHRNSRDIKKSNDSDRWIYPGGSDAEYDAGSYPMDLVSNGFKIRHNGNYQNTNNSYIYLAIGQSIVGTNNVPATAR